MSALATVSGSSVLQALLIAAGTATIGAILAYVVGVRVTDYWDERKRRREADLAALAQFYRLYGDFFATWKLWNTHKKYATTVATPEHTQWDLLQQAEEAEAGFEAFLVKLVAEWELEAGDIELLGCFREGYQTLRERIRVNKALDWRASPPGGWSQPHANINPRERSTGFEQYRAFKILAEHFAKQLANHPHRRKPSRGTEHDARLLAVTNRDAFRNWWELVGERFPKAVGAGIRADR